MNTDAQMQDAGAELPDEMFDRAPRISVPVNAEAVRSRENIRAWSAYLPKSCVKLMIQMGWDKST